MGRDRETELLAWLGGAQEHIEDLSIEDVELLLNALGVTGELAEKTIRTVVATLDASKEDFDTPPFRNALLYGLSRIPGQVAQLAQQQAQKRGRALNLTESPEVTADGHGTVHRGRSEHGLGGSRPHVYLWLQPLEESPCSEYFWYQFAQPTLLVDGDDETDTVQGFTYPTSGGATMGMGEWRADFIQQGVDDVNSARNASGKPDLPEFQPPGLRRSPHSTRRPEGKPYIGVPIPGHRGEGVVDAPNLCYRGPNPTARTISNISRVAQRHIRRRTRSSRTQPTGGSMEIAIVVNFRSYLVCIDDPVTCIGYVEWAYTTTTTVQYEWRPTESTHMGAGPKRWRRTITQRGDCTYRLDIGDFLPC